MGSCVGKNKDQSSEKKEMENFKQEIDNDPCQENEKIVFRLKRLDY